jgi:hypothetical protein
MGYPDNISSDPKQTLSLGRNGAGRCEYRADLRQNRELLGHLLQLSIETEGIVLWGD